MYSLWGNTPAQNYQLPSSDYAVAWSMCCIAYQCHRRSTMHTGIGSAANGAQRNPSPAKVHNLSCKIVPRDSSLIATKESCNQAYISPPTRSPSKMFHQKTAFSRLFFIHAQHLATYPFSKQNPNQRSSSNNTNKQQMKSLGQRD